MATIPPQVLGILEEIRPIVESLHGERLAKLILYGSQARGDARLGSDIDVLLVMDGEFDEADAFRQTKDATIRQTVLASIQWHIVSESHFAAGNDALYRNIWREGIAVENLASVAGPAAPPEERIGSAPSVDLDAVDRRPEQLKWLQKARDCLAAADALAGMGHTTLPETHQALLHLGRIFLLGAGSDELGASAVPEAIERLTHDPGGVPEELSRCVSEAHELQMEADRTGNRAPATKIVELTSRAHEFLRIAEEFLGPAPDADQENP